MEYRKKSDARQHEGIESLIQNHCYTMIDSSDEEENEINGVMTHAEDAY